MNLTKLYTSFYGLVPWSEQGAVLKMAGRSRLFTASITNTVPVGDAGNTNSPMTQSKSIDCKTSSPSFTSDNQRCIKISDLSWSHNSSWLLLLVFMPFFLEISTSASTPDSALLIIGKQLYDDLPRLVAVSATRSIITFAFCGFKLAYLTPALVVGPLMMVTGGGVLALVYYCFLEPTVVVDLTNGFVLSWHHGAPTDSIQIRIQQLHNFKRFLATLPPEQHSILLERLDIFKQFIRVCNEHLFTTPIPAEWTNSLTINDLLAWPKGKAANPRIQVIDRLVK